jgi:hypothetical protein
MDSILVVNHKEKQCGIHQYGVNIWNALFKSRKHAYIYCECSGDLQLQGYIKSIRPSAIIYNHYPATMPWLTPTVTRRYTVPQLGIMHEVTQESADNATNELFDYHLCPDPTLIENNPICRKTKRLIPPYINHKPYPAIPTIGSFGFGFSDKGFERLVTYVQDNLDDAAINLLMPDNHIVGKRIELNPKLTAKRCRELVRKPRITLNINHGFLSHVELLDFLAGNTINCFLYDVEKHKGISSTVEQALAVHRPIALTRCGMFRHMFSAPVFIEDLPLWEIVNQGIEPLKPFYREWSEQAFINDYDRIIGSIL